MRTLGLVGLVAMVAAGVAGLLLGTIPAEAAVAVLGAAAVCAALVWAAVRSRRWWTLILVVPVLALAGWTVWASFGVSGEINCVIRSDWVARATCGDAPGADEPVRYSR